MISLTESDNRSQKAFPGSINEPVIRLENVSVRYRLPRETIKSVKEYTIKRILQRRLIHDEFLALDDVSLDIERGELFGLIGRNGAGKSTLLKVISRVLRPTSGRLQLRGRVAPLLELGAGFHFELTGRENVFLNASLLGYSRAQTAERLDEIVDFAEISDFIDAPLRTYSTGMVARLGFAVATTTQPDILIIDEVLSVGDEHFQRKCRERINEFRNNKATILLVTHSMEVARSMCNRVAWLEGGRVRALGLPEEIVASYQQNS